MSPSILNTAGIHPKIKIKRVFTRFPCEIIAIAGKKQSKIQNPRSKTKAASRPLPSVAQDAKDAKKTTVNQDIDPI
jgi:hypothetical protein